VSVALELWRALEARHNLRGPDGRFIKAGGGGSDRPSLADVIRGTAAGGPKRQRDNKGGMTIADAVRNAAQMSDTTGRPTQVPAKPRRGRQVSAAVPARLTTRAQNPEAPILQQVDEYHLKWRGGPPEGWSQADLDERSRVLDDYMNEVGDASPWNLRSANPSSAVRGHLDEVMATSPLTEDVVVWRGLAEPRLLFGDRLDQPDMTGASVTDPSFASTSTSRAAAGEYATQTVADGGGVVVEMHVPAGVGAVNLGGDQNEVLLDRDLRWTVTSDSGPGRSPRNVAVRVDRSDGGMSVADAELAASRPAPAKRTPSSRRKPVDAAAITAQLDAATSLDGARGHLAGLTVPQLRQVAEHTGVALGSGDTKARALDRIVNSVVGRRLDSAAIDRMTRR
jgi:hypothetical protein